MTDTEDDDNFDKAFENFGEDPTKVTPPVVDPATPPVTPPVEPPKEEPKPAEEPKKDEEPAKKPEEAPPVAADEKKPEEGAKPAEDPATPPAPETPSYLTKDDVKSVVSDLLSNERSSGKELDTTAKEVLDAYYPDGLSNILVDEKSGKELRTPADVVAATGGDMSTEEAAQWLMNEQYKLDKQVATIKNDARDIAETTVNFKRDSIAVLQKYEPLFKAYPSLQKKTFDKMMKLVKANKEKGVILSAPDVTEFYDDALEPYQLAFEHSTKQSATNPTPPAEEVKKPTAEDRMDEGGDGGSSNEVDDPNDFAQQVKKELAKEL